MNLDGFSIIELEKKIKEVETIEEKIKLIAYEIMRCKRTIQDIEDEVANIDPTNVKLITKVNCSDNTILSILNNNREIKNAAIKELLTFCGKKLCEQLRCFLSKAQIDYEYYQAELDVKVKTNGFYLNGNMNDKPSDCKDKIVWMSGKDRLLKLFDALKENKILTEYSTEEILVHFSNERQIPFIKGICNTEKLRWCKSDSSFSIFVDELAKRVAIEDENKYKVFEKHFCNKNSKPFKYLAQKKNHTNNFTETGKWIRKILDSIVIPIIFFISHTSFRFYDTFSDFLGSISEYIIT